MYLFMSDTYENLVKYLKYLFESSGSLHSSKISKCKNLTKNINQLNLHDEFYFLI